MSLFRVIGLLQVMSVLASFGLLQVMSLSIPAVDPASPFFFSV